MPRQILAGNALQIGETFLHAAAPIQMRNLRRKHARENPGNHFVSFFRKMEIKMGGCAARAASIIAD
jgi:hypothetical protein